MNSSLRRAFAAGLSVLFLLAGILRSDIALPGNVLDPNSAAQAWNVIRLATKNVELLLEEDRVAEIPVQISYCSPSLRALIRLPQKPDTVDQIEELTKRAMVSVNATAAAALQNNSGGAKAAFASLRKIVAGIADLFDSEIVNADIFTCPVHSDFLSEKPATRCGKCGKRLLSRRIPYSSIYIKPGEPTARMAASTSGPVQAGRTIEVKLTMAKLDNSPLPPEDLLAVRSHPIDLLITEPGLGDFHHIQPTPGKVPGEYVFSFTPKKSVAHRVWADITPIATGIPELPFVDLPSPEEPEPFAAAESRFTTAVDGYRFELLLATGNHLPAKARQARRISVTVATADGKPVTNLAPVMNAFADLVGFYADFQTVIRPRPNGGEILNPDLRSGPTLGFTLFPPKAGILRLFCQVRIDGKSLVAPFTLNVEP